MYPSPVAARDQGKIYRIATGPTGRLLALAMDTVDGEVKLLDGWTLAPRGGVLLGAMRTARGCALSPNDTLLAAGTPDDVTLFDLASRSVRWRVHLAGDEAAMTFSLDGTRLLVSRSSGEAVLLSVRDGTELGALSMTDEPRAVFWDARGIVLLGPKEWVVVTEPDGPITRELPAADLEGNELCAIDTDRVAAAGTSPRGVWLAIMHRKTGRTLQILRVEDDRRAEGLVFAGGVLFLSTEGGIYRADAPYEQLVRWLPPLGGAHDPTRMAAVADGHVAIAARDVRVFRTRS